MKSVQESITKAREEKTRAEASKAVSQNRQRSENSQHQVKQNNKNQLEKVF